MGGNHDATNIHPLQSSEEMPPSSLKSLFSLFQLTIYSMSKGVPMVKKQGCAQALDELTIDRATMESAQLKRSKGYPTDVTEAANDFETNHTSFSFFL